MTATALAQMLIFAADTPTFAALLLAVVAITSGLTLAPALFLGPLAEGL